MCPLCQNDDTISHLYQCQHRQTWRMTFDQALKDQLTKLKTPTSLTEVICNTFNQLLHDQARYYHFYHFTLFVGLIPSAWSVQHKNSASTSSTKQWALKISKWLIMQGHELWLTRNQQFNDNDTQSTHHQQLNQQIDQLYQLQEKFSITDRNLFTLSLIHI